MSENITGPPSPTASTVTDVSSSTVTSKSHLAAGALFIITALENIQKSKQGKKNKELNEAVTKALDVIKSSSDTTVCTASDSETLLLPLKLACQTGMTSLIVIAIDCIGNLITYNYIANGEAIPTIVLTAPEPSVAETNPEMIEGQDKVSLGEPGMELSPSEYVPLTDRIIDLVCDCFTGEGTNDKIQLQIIKALLAAITSDTFTIHQRALLKAVRTTYNIFLLSRDPVNQTIAQGTLTQMVHAIFGRIKVNKATITEDSNAGTTAHHSQTIRNDSRQDVEEILLEQDPGDLSLTVPSPDPIDQGDKREKHDDEPAVEQETISGSIPTVEVSPSSMTRASPELNHIETISEEFTKISDDDLVDVPLGSNVESSIVASATEITENPTPTELSSSPSTEDPQHQSSSGSSPKERMSGEHRKSDSISSAFKDNDLPKSSSVTHDETVEDHGNMESQRSVPNDMEVRDAYLLFRALCRLSMKPITTEGASDVKSLSMRSKLLSLHLILTIITSHLEAFASPNVGFVTYTENNQSVHITLLASVKQYLCLSLSRNLALTVGGIFEVSLEIFLKLLQGLRMLLKKEIEVFFKEIFLPILEMRSASFHQKLILLGVLEKICNDPQTLVEIYLNYDCDKEALDNIYERLVNVLSKITSIHTDSASSGSSHIHQNPNSVAPSNGVIQPSLTTTSLNNTLASQLQLQNQGNENDIRQKALECLVAVLRSLTTWSDKGLMINEGENPVFDDEKLDRTSSRKSEDGYESNLSPVINGYSSPSPILNGSSHSVRSLPLDDPSQFESLKHKKQILQQGIQMFNWRPKKGLNFLLETQCIENNEPKTIARFLLKSEGVNKTTLGEFLGEGNEENIAIMHAFVDLMNFGKMHFVDALRKFLQPFRLPGEAQKIDRFMLKFAERYVISNAGVFANADTAYVLAYSVIMLNTDLHNPQVKNRMTKVEFLKNNAGIDDKSDLPVEFLEEIYDDISKNEIRIKDEQGASSNSTSSGPMSIFRDLSPFEVITGKARREFNAHASAELASKMEAIFKGRSRRGISRLQATYYSASHFEHVRPMFELVWMSFLAGVSTPMQDYDDLEIVNLCLEGLKFSIHIASVFDMELERNAFVSTLAKFTYLNNLSEMKVKNVEAIKTLLGIAHSEGNYLKESWRDVLACVSQLEQFQLISSGADGDTVPDLTKARRFNGSQSHLEKRQSITSLHSNKSNRNATVLNTYAEEAAIETRSQQVVVAVDRIFTGSVRLSGHAVVDFVRALSEISMEEIHSSKNAEHPRTYCLQKLVEICYYNMNRIRMEWSNMWDILGDHFNQVGCHSNANVGFFALDSLRQLSMKFLEKEELPHFKFQKDFLKPFEFILEHNRNYNIKDMVLRCLQQMIQARGYHIRSGWKTMFGVFSKAAKEDNEAIVAMAFEIVQSISKENFHEIAIHGYLDDFVSCLIEFCKNTRFVKISLHSMEIYKQVTQDLIAQQASINVPSDSNESPTLKEDSELAVWLPIMVGLCDIIMNCEDLEVRNRALDFMFATFKQYGTNFTEKLWTSMFQQIIFPMFHDLDSTSKKFRFRNQEDMSVWISTTLVHALRNTIDLLTFYFDTLKGLMDGVLELLTVCITQENETLGRIGNSCLQRLIENNVARLDNALWDKICTTFVTLFDQSSPQGLFDFRKTLLGSESSANPPLNGLSTRSSSLPAASYYQMDQHKQEFRRITSKCVLRLLLVQTVDDLFNSNDVVYHSIDSHHLFILIDCLERSYSFAQRFNSDMELRNAIYEADLMPQLPNLFRQETQSAQSCIFLLFKMYRDTTKDRQNYADEVEDKLVPLCHTILNSYNMIQRNSVDSNLEIWRPIIVKVLNKFSELEEPQFTKHVPKLYPQILGLFASKLHTDVRLAVQNFLKRLGDVYKILS